MTSPTPGNDALLIRRMQSRDLEPVMQLTQRIPEAPAWGLEDFRKLISLDAVSRDESRSRIAWVAELRNQVLGLVVVQHLLVAGDAPATAECELESILVHPASRRMGLGRLLLAQAVDWCLQQRAAVLRLEVRTSNVAALHLYAKHGFVPAGTRPRYYAHPEEDALLMQHSLGR